MNIDRRSFVGLGAAGLAALGGCVQPQTTSDSSKQDQTSSPQQTNNTEFEKLALDMSAWKYDAANDCYYQLGLTYCLEPANTSYESLAIFVPGAYFKGEKNGSNYTCTVAKDAVVGKFTPATAPVVMPLNSSFIMAQASPTAYSYEGLEKYLTQGFVYVYPGFRGRSAGFVSDSKTAYPGGAPWPVVDLKAAVRYLRYNAQNLPFNNERIFLFGHGAGAGVGAAVGASGDAGIYEPYLLQIKAATHDVNGTVLSDKISGCALWCPVTSYDVADAAYEWCMGQFSNVDTRAEGTWTRSFSQNLANSYGNWVNSMDLKDENDTALTLAAVQDGTYLDGTYYTYIMNVIQQSAADFCANTTFPYTQTQTTATIPLFPGDPNLKIQGTSEIDLNNGGAASTGEQTSENAPTGVSVVQSTVYETLSSYLASLNVDSRWLTYSSSRKQARISGLWDFVSVCKKPNRAPGAYDAPDRSTVTNQLFGINDESTLHFSKMVSDVLTVNQDAYTADTNFKKSYVKDYEDDLAKTDDLGTSQSARVDAMNPLYFLSGAYAGYGSAQVAAHWRINAGLFQVQNPLTDEVNLALALKHYAGVEDVTLTEVWGKGFELAETQGDAQDNMVSWIINLCAPAETTS